MLINKLQWSAKITLTEPEGVLLITKQNKTRPSETHEEQNKRSRDFTSKENNKCINGIFTQLANLIHFVISRAGPSSRGLKQPISKKR